MKFLFEAHKTEGGRQV